MEEEVLTGEQQLRQRTSEIASEEARLTSQRQVLVVRKEALSEVGAPSSVASGCEMIFLIGDLDRAILVQIIIHYMHGIHVYIM